MCGVQWVSIKRAMEPEVKAEHPVGRPKGEISGISANIKKGKKKTKKGKTEDIGVGQTINLIKFIDDVKSTSSLTMLILPHN
jgi:hypothetical protein